MNIQLVHNKGFKWFNQGNIFFKGFLYDDTNIYENKDAIKLLEQIKTYEELKRFAQNANGLFTIIIRKAEGVLIATDIVRTFPLFFCPTKPCLISDDPNILNDNQFDEILCRQFQLAGYMFGDRTLLKNVYQSESSQIIFISDTEIRKEFYFNYASRSLFKESEAILAENLKNIILSVFKRMIKSLKGRTVALPLSGGFDSRLIAVLLKLMNYENVICYTYGVDQNPEQKISKKVAEKLGYKWFFIDYEKIDNSKYLNQDCFRDYVQFNAKYSSFPYLQDFFATEAIKRNNLVPEDAVFIPGHSGDALAGSTLKGRFSQKSSKRKIIREIKNSDLSTSFADIKKPITEELKKQFKDRHEFSYSLYEEWIIREHLAKCIVNSASVFDFFGYEYRLPFWDMELVYFFKYVPLELKNYKKLYDKVICREFFAPFELNFSNELQASKREHIIHNYKTKIKHFIPKSIVRKLQSSTKWTAYEHLTKPMLKILEHSKYKNNLSNKHNSIIINWYLDFILRKEK